MYLSYISRTRERECLAQRGKRRKGRQRSVARNYVSEMANNRWETKYPAFARSDQCTPYSWTTRGDPTIVLWFPFSHCVLR